MDKENSMSAASEEASRQITNLVSREELEKLNHVQHLILGRLQDSNAVLSHFNNSSEQSFTAVASDFSKNTRLLKSMKADLDHIFRRIRNMKAQISSQCSDAFKDISDVDLVDKRPDLEERT